MGKAKRQIIHITKWPPKTEVEDVRRALGKFIFSNERGLRPRFIYVIGWRDSTDPQKLKEAGFDFEIAA